MKKLMFAVLAASMAACTAPVCESVEVALTVNDTIGRKMMIAPMGVDANSTMMTINDNRYCATLETSPLGFYHLVSVKENAQIILPYYVPVNKGKSASQITFGERARVDLDGSQDNEALAAYLNAYAQTSRAIWSPNADLTTPDLLKSYITKADSILKVYRCSEPVKEYLRIWGYVSAYEDYASVQRILKLKTGDMPYSRADLMAQSHSVFNSPIAALFPSTLNIVYAGIPNKSDLNSAFDYVAQHYTDTTLIKKVNNYIAGRYVSSYDYRNEFDKGLENLQAATERYNLDPLHAENFAKRRATVPGQLFPEGIVLQDRDGNVVDFSAFRGKYVYIDMWASWCVPCLREVPELQKLEKTLKNKKVEFVSISIDANQDAWKKKMDEKNMHGNQLWNPKGTLGTALNVKGIPFFAIYDPEGKLYMYGAPRPSQGQGLVELLEGLK
ncbi:MAG: TlpA family protein disulfide reductase [Bacteroidaceae bacterium]|nr:TlpA family protein disulfide reductase [Bacteroidaceae bacterium]